MKCYNTQSSKAMVKMLTDMLTDVLDIDEQVSSSRTHQVRTMNDTYLESM
jgi:hypothetical protein